MGAYLSEPVTAKASEDGTGNGLNYGVSGMQGWRISMEVIIFKLKLTLALHRKIFHIRNEDFHLNIQFSFFISTRPVYSCILNNVK